MRLFVAITPPEVAMAELADAVAPHRVVYPGLHWTAADLWHITLAFLGNVPENMLPELETSLMQVAAGHHTLPLALHGCGTFPCDSRAHVLWAGIDGARDELAGLAQAVAGAASNIGAAQPDTRAMHPHLTLARCRTLHDLRPLRIGLAGFSGTPWQADSFDLIHSVLGKTTRHHSLQTFTLS